MMMVPQRQQTWGWLAAIYVFSAGLGGGVFLFSFILNMAGRYESVARIGALSGPLLAGMGTLFLLGDLGSLTRAYRLFASPSAFMPSGMGRGVWILTGFFIFGLAYALPSF